MVVGKYKTYLFIYLQTFYNVNNNLYILKYAHSLLCYNQVQTQKQKHSDYVYVYSVLTSLSPKIHISYLSRKPFEKKINSEKVDISTWWITTNECLWKNKI